MGVGVGYDSSTNKPNDNEKKQQQQHKIPSILTFPCCQRPFSSNKQQGFWL